MPINLYWPEIVLCNEHDEASFQLSAHRCHYVAVKYA